MSNAAFLYELVRSLNALRHSKLVNTPLSLLAERRRSTSGLLSVALAILVTGNLLDNFVLLVNLHVVEFVAGPDFTFEGGSHPHGNPDLFVFVSSFETSHFSVLSLTLGFGDFPLRRQ